jgi:hypothetical protein
LALLVLVWFCFLFFRRLPCPKLPPSFQSFARAGLNAVSAANAFRAIWRKAGVNPHFAHFFACPAIIAAAFAAHAVKRDLVEKSVKSAQRAQILAKEPVGND